jgi:hypothetical protein
MHSCILISACAHDDVPPSCVPSDGRLAALASRRNEGAIVDPIVVNRVPLVRAVLVERVARALAPLVFEIILINAEIVGEELECSSFIHTCSLVPISRRSPTANTSGFAPYALMLQGSQGRPTFRLPVEQ